MHFQHVCLHGFGYALPPRVVSSDEIEQRLAPVYQRLKLPLGRLEMMSGIRERRFWEPGTRPSAAAALAGQAALDQANLRGADIDCLIFTSVSRDMLEPASASFVHHRLGLPAECLTFDLSNACLGFLDGMLVLAGLIEQGVVRNGLIVAGETAEDLVESTITALLADQSLTRQSIKPSFASLTIGSGAVALVMGDSRIHDSGHRLTGGAWRADTSQSHLCQGSSTQGGILMATDSEQLLNLGVKTAHATWQTFLQNLDWSRESMARYYCHQVGQAHASRLNATLDLEPAKAIESFANFGNIGSVAAPLTMARDIEQGGLASGERAALLGIGSGIACLMLGVEW